MKAADGKRVKAPSFKGHEQSSSLFDLLTPARGEPPSKLLRDDDEDSTPLRVTTKRTNKRMPSNPPRELANVFPVAMRLLQHHHIVTTS